METPKTKVALRVGVLTLVIGGMLLLGIMPRLAQQKKLQAMAATREREGLLVTVVRPHFSPSSGSLVLPGNVQAIEETTINARTSGYLKRRYVDIGSRVSAGEVLAEIEAPELDQQLIRAQAEASRSRAGREQAEADSARLSANVAQADAELARTRSNREAASADLSHTKAKLLEVESAKSEALAKLDQSKRRLSGQRANLSRAKSRYALAEKTWKRWQELARGGAVSGQELDQTQADYESAQAAVDGAQADVESAQADVDGAGQAVRSREGDVAAAQADVSAAEQKVKAADAAVSSAQASLRAMRANVQAGRANVRAAQANIEASRATVQGVASLRDYERVLAPFSGVITARNVDNGALITAGSGSAALDPTSTVPHTGLFGIARTDVVRVQVQVPQSFMSAARRGQKARVLVQEFPGRSFEGTVAFTSGALDASSRTLLCEVQLPNRTGDLVPGMYAQVQFVTPQSRATVRVPANTLVIDAAGTRVATVDGSHRIHFRIVKVGRDYGKEVEITEGLVGNEQLVDNPTDELTENAEVHLESEPR